MYGQRKYLCSFIVAEPITGASSDFCIGKCHETEKEGEIIEGSRVEVENLFDQEDSYYGCK